MTSEIKVSVLCNIEKNGGVRVLQECAGIFHLQLPTAISPPPLVRKTAESTVWGTATSGVLICVSFSAAARYHTSISCKATGGVSGGSSVTGCKAAGSAGTGIIHKASGGETSVRFRVFSGANCTSISCKVTAGGSSGEIGICCKTGGDGVSGGGIIRNVTGLIGVDCGRVGTIGDASGGALFTSLTTDGPQAVHFTAYKGHAALLKT